MNRRIYKLLFFCMVSMISVFVHAASLQVKYHIGDGSEVTSSGNEGELSKLLGDEENAMKVTQLSVIGNLNGVDISLLKKMAGKEGKGSLNSLNLSEATFTETGKRVPDNIFQNCKNLQHVDLSNMTEIGKCAFKTALLPKLLSLPLSPLSVKRLLGIVVPWRA